MDTKHRLSTVCAALIFCLSSPGIAQDVPSDVRDLVGTRAAGGEAQLLSRGYVHISTQTGSDRKWSNWWHADTGRCITVATYDGRYNSIVSTLPGDCGFSLEAAASAPGYRPTQMPAPTPAYSDEVHLTCFGEGKKPQTRTYRTLRWDRREHEFDTDYRTYLSNKEFDSMVQIDIVGRSGHIWLPKDLQPIIHSGGDHGWWEIQDLRVSSATITGNYRLNGLNKPRIKFDRRNNWLEIDGQRGFKGYCELSRS